MWNGFLDWVKSEPLQAQLMDKADFDVQELVDHRLIVVLIQ